METDVRKNPALLKLDLYCRGLRIDTALERGGTRGRGLLRTRAGLGSGLELVLPGGLHTNVPVREPFAAASPYLLVEEAGALALRHDEIGFVCRVEPAPRPAWYERTTSSGKPMTRIATLQGTVLAIYPARVCDHWVSEQDDRCRFCSVGLNLGKDDADGKSIDEVVEVVQAARAESRITYVDFNTGHHEGDTYLDVLAPYLARVKAATGLLIGVQTPPHPDLARYRELRRLGVNRVSFCFELYDPDRFREVCPGKHRLYGLERYLAAIEYCARQVGPTGRDFEPWIVNGEIIAGLEPAERSIAAIDWITSVGAVPTVCVFRPLLGTLYEALPPPRTAEIVPVFRRLYEACMQRRLPIGVAPGVHVSLVLLPEEARALQDDPDRFRLGELRLRLLRWAFAKRLGRELTRASARAA